MFPNQEHQVLPEYNEENYGDDLKINEDPLNEMSNFDLDEEEKERKFNNAQGEFEDNAQFNKYKKVSDPSYQQEGKISEINQIINIGDNALPIQPCDAPSYDDFLITNNQINKDQKIGDHLSQCSEPADLQRLKVKSKIKHKYRQNSSNIFDSYDLEGLDFEGEVPDEEIQRIKQEQKQNSNISDTQQQENMKRPYIDYNISVKQTRSNAKDFQENELRKQYQLQSEKKEEHLLEDSYEKRQHDFELFDSSQLTTVNKGPRRPLSPYIFFSQEKRKELKKEHPEWNSSQIMKTVSVLWQKMSTEEKKNFQEQSKKDRERYDHERQDFIQKKHDDESNDEHHTVLETVKNRAKIIQKIKDSRKQSEDIYEHYIPAKRKHPKRSKRSSQHKASNQSLNQQTFDNEGEESIESRSNNVSKETSLNVKKESSKSQSYKAEQLGIIKEVKTEDIENNIIQQPKEISAIKKISTSSMEQFRDMKPVAPIEQSPERQDFRQSSQQLQQISKHPSLIQQQIQQLQAKQMQQNQENAQRFFPTINLGQIQPRQFPPTQRNESPYPQVNQVSRNLPSPSPQPRIFQYQQIPGQQQAIYPNYYPNSINLLQIQPQQQYPPQIIGQQQPIGQFNTIIGGQYQIPNIQQSQVSPTDQIFNQNQRTYIVQPQQQILDLQPQISQQSQQMAQANPQNPPLQPYEYNPLTINLQNMSSGGGGCNYNNNGQIQPVSSYEDMSTKQSYPIVQNIQYPGQYGANFQGQLITQSPYPNNFVSWNTGPPQFEQKIPSARESTNRVPQLNEEDFNNDQFNQPIQRISSTSLHRMPSATYQQIIDPQISNYPSFTQLSSVQQSQNQLQQFGNFFQNPPQYINQNLAPYQSYDKILQDQLDDNDQDQQDKDENEDQINQ